MRRQSAFVRYVSTTHAGSTDQRDIKETTVLASAGAGAAPSDASGKDVTHRRVCTFLSVVDSHWSGSVTNRRFNRAMAQVHAGRAPQTIVVTGGLLARSLLTERSRRAEAWHPVSNGIDGVNLPRSSTLRCGNRNSFRRFGRSTAAATRTQDESGAVPSHASGVGRIMVPAPLRRLVSQLDRVDADPTG